MTYRPPVRDMAFTLTEVAGLGKLYGTSGFEDLSADLVEAVLDEGAKFAADVLAPLNRAGDVAGLKLDKADVATAPGFADAYRQWREAGWGRARAQAR